MYTFKITAGKDKLNDLDLVDNIDKPNPWNFTTVGDEPVITLTTPGDGDTNVYLLADIVVTFSEPMNTAITFSCNPDPGGWGNPVWNAVNDEVTFSHTGSFSKNTPHTFTITAAKDLDGLDFISTVLNPFTFTTAGDNPMIIGTTPEDSAINVGLGADIVVEFSKPMEASTVLFTITPDVTVTPDWSVDKMEVTFTHTAEFTKNTPYTCRITAGKDTSGYDIIAGSIPNPFVFTTVGD
jgi:hypothetical protein